jgi:hypothetical protein
MSKKVKVLKVSADTTKGFWTRSVFAPTMDKIIEDWAKKGYSLLSTVPVNDRRGKTTHYLLTFQKDG